MADETNGGGGGGAAGQVVVTIVDAHRVQVAMSQGLSLDTAEAALYRALKFFEREIQTQKIREALAPRIALARDLMPRGPFAAGA